MRKGERGHSVISEVTSPCLDHLPFMRIKSLGPSHAQGEGMTQGVISEAALSHQLGRSNFQVSVSFAFK